MQSLLTPYIANDMMRKKLTGGLTNMDKSAILRQTDRQTESVYFNLLNDRPYR